MRQFVEQSKENVNTDQQHLSCGEGEVDEQIQQLNDIVTRAVFSSNQSC
jgi:archaellum component FlaC